MRSFAKLKKFEKSKITMEVGGVRSPNKLENSPCIHFAPTYQCVFSLYVRYVVSHYDLSVHVHKGFPRFFYRGGWVE